MSCNDCEPRLTALADRELGRVDAWRVRRHLARCARCAALYAEMGRVDAAARAFRAATADAPVPADLSDRVLRQLAGSPAGTGPVPDAFEAFDSQEVTMPSTTAAATHRPLADILFPPALRSVAAATAVLVAAVGFGAHVLVPGTPRVAFADVLRAVRQVNTAHIRIRLTPLVPGGETTQTYEAWLRAEPAGFAMLMGEGVRLVGDGKGILMYPGEGNGKPIRISEEKITREVITDLLISPGALLGDKPGKPHTIPTDWGTPEWVKGPNGATLLCFQAEKNGTHATLWADPETQRPVRVDVLTLAGESAMRTEVDFAYNETPPPGTF